MEILKPGTVPVVPQTDLRGTCSKCGAEVKCTDMTDEAIFPYPRSSPVFMVNCPTDASQTTSCPWPMWLGLGLD